MFQWLQVLELGSHQTSSSRSFQTPKRSLQLPHPPNSSPSSLFCAQYLQFLQLSFIGEWPYVCPRLPGRVFAYKTAIPTWLWRASPFILESLLDWGIKIMFSSCIIILVPFLQGVCIPLCLQPGSCYFEIVVFGILLLWKVENWEKMQMYFLSSV